MFAKSFMDDLINVCKFFGPRSVLFLSNEDKAMVPFGLAATSLQASILMHMEHKVRLHDHNFVVGPSYTLVPPVYVAWEIKENRDCRTPGIPLLEFVVVNMIPHIHMHMT